MEDQINKLAQTVAELTTTITNLQITHRTELERLAQLSYQESEWNITRLQNLEAEIMDCIETRIAMKALERILQQESEIFTNYLSR